MKLDIDLFVRKTLCSDEDFFDAIESAELTFDCIGSSTSHSTWINVSIPLNYKRVDDSEETHVSYVEWLTHVRALASHKKDMAEFKGVVKLTEDYTFDN